MQMSLINDNQGNLHFKQMNRIYKNEANLHIMQIRYKFKNWSTGVFDYAGFNGDVSLIT